jgi:hypothetical protein
MVRREAEVPPPPGSGLTGREKRVTASDGTTVWVMIGTMPAQQVPAGQADSVRQEAAEFDSIFVDYKDKGHKVELVGREVKDGVAQFHVKVTRRSGPVQHYYLDATSGLETKILTDVVDPNGGRFTVERELGDYRKVDGRMVPFTMKESSRGQTVAEMTIERIEFNLPLEDSLFRFPSAK